MDLDSRVQLSYYEKVSEINEEHHISLVRHIKTGKIYVRKDLSVYNEQVYQELIKHPVKGIPRVYCAYEENQTLTIIEDYIAGETLDDMLNDGHTFSEMEVINIGIELSELLWKLHTQKPAVIHRDMKPSNVIIAPDGHPFILDLNASRISIPKTEDTDLIGTKGYAAPEQYGFGSSDQRTDIYALGMLMNALLCGHFSQEISVRASKRFRRILRICTKIDPYKRFKNMDILNEELTYLKEHYFLVV